MSSSIKDNRILAIVRTLVGIILFLVLIPYSKAMVLDGHVRLGPGWEPVLYLSVIEDIEDLHTASYQFLIAEIRLDSSGAFHVVINGLPEADHIYRLHACQEGDPVSTIMIGGKHENFIHFIGNADAHVTITQAPGLGQFKDLEVKGVPANASFQKLLGWRRQLQGTASIPSEQNEMRLRRDLESRFARMVDTSQNLLVRLCALNFLEEISEEPPVGLYRQLEENLSEADTSPYALQFRERAAFLAFRAGEKGNGGSRFPAGIAAGLLAVLLAGSFLYFNHSQARGDQDPAGEGGYDLGQLSIQEMRVWELLQLRKSNKEIAAELNIEVTTVKSHVYRIFHKLGISSRREAWVHGSRISRAE